MKNVGKKMCADLPPSELDQVIANGILNALAAYEPRSDSEA